MNSPGQSDQTNEGDPASTAESIPALTEKELRAQDAEPLPSREAMSTLIWAPGPGTIAPAVDAIVGDESA
jgi:hypothetical protein